MPTLIQSKYAKGILPVPYPSDASGIVAKRFHHTVLANPTVNDVLELGVLPAGCRLIDMILDGDDMDSNGAPTIAFDCGIISGDWGNPDSARTVGQEFFAGSTLLQAGGVARPTLKTAFRTTLNGADRAVGLKWTAVAATFVSGDIGMTMVYAAD